MTPRTRLITILFSTLVIFGHTAHAQLIDNTVRCSVPNCLVYAVGIDYQLDIEVTAFAIYNGVGHNLDAFADLLVGNCNVAVIGQVDGGIAVGVFGNEIGIQAHAMGAIPPDFEADLTEINYIDGSLGISGGGNYPC